jgi:hypothetical protein
MLVCINFFLQILPLLGLADSKNKLMRSVAGGGVEQMNSLQTRWDKFELMMESHQLMVKEQVDSFYVPLVCLSFQRMSCCTCCGAVQFLTRKTSGEFC